MISKSRLKYIQSLHHKKLREQNRVFLAEGTKMVEEALQFAPHLLREAYATPEWQSANPHLLAQMPVACQEITEADMQRMSTLHTPPGVQLLLQMPSDALHSFSGLTLLLDAVQDPGNLGTIIRTADWFGVQQIICGSGTADVYNPKVVQATMGSIFRVKLLHTDLSAFLDAHPEIPLVVAHLEGEPLSAAPLPTPAFLVIGNESKGVGQPLADRANLKIRIPGKGTTESLNAAVAAAILMYAWTS
jgi:TrmH family RNA methyltransferase